MSKVITPAEFATEVGSDPRTVRKFLRANGTKVGKGARHTIPGDKRSLTSLTRQFNAWVEARDAAKAKGDENEVAADENEGDENTNENA